MIYPSQAVRIVIATKPVDFRKGHDGLAALAGLELGLDPHSGIIVVFRPSAVTGSRCCCGMDLAWCYATNGWNKASLLGPKCAMAW